MGKMTQFQIQWVKATDRAETHNTDCDSPPEDVDFRGVVVNNEDWLSDDQSPPASQPFTVVECDEKCKQSQQQIPVPYVCNVAALTRQQ